MLAIAKRLGIVTFCVVVAVSVVLPGEAPVKAQGLYGARYCQAGDQVFWFVHASDVHIGASGSTDTDNLTWLVTTARSVINPLFTVVTGDLTDSTNGGLFGPTARTSRSGRRTAAILDAAGVTRRHLLRSAGEPRRLQRRDFAYYKAYAIQGADLRAATARWRGRRTSASARTTSSA